MKIRLSHEDFTSGCVTDSRRWIRRAVMNLQHKDRVEITRLTYGGYEMHDVEIQTWPRRTTLPPSQH